MSNPFRIGGTITGEFFTDREAELQRITATLREPQAKLVVYGPRRMGKSSALEVARQTVERRHGIPLRLNHKKLSSGSGPDRDEQFAYIAQLREDFARRGQPIVSIDAKKKELVGRFKNPGTAWAREPVLVNDHDFPGLALGKVTPFGIYDLLANRGTVYVGTSHDTPYFAVDNVARWWQGEGELRYPDATELLVLPKSVRISDRQMKELDVETHETQPRRNYTIYPTCS